MMEWFDSYIGVPGLVYMALPLVFLAMGYLVKTNADRLVRDDAHARSRR